MHTQRSNDIPVGVEAPSLDKTTTVKVQEAKHDLALFPGTDSKGGLVLTTCIIMHIPYNREYNNQLFYLELVSPMGRSIHGVNVFME